MHSCLAFLRRHPGKLLVLATATLFAVLYLGVAGNGWGTYRRVAAAMISGRLDIPAEQIGPGHIRELSFYQNRWYYPLGVLPTLVLMPGVALFGLDFPQGAVVFTLAVMLGVLVYRLGRRLNLDENGALWLVFGVMLASPLPYLVMRATVFDAYLPQLLSLVCLLGALVESLGSRRWFWCGVLVGLSAMARPVTGLATIFFLLVILRQPGEPRRKRHAIVQHLLPVIAAGLLVAGYNAARFGNSLEAGYAYQLPVPATVPFSLAYLPTNLYRLLLQAPLPLFAEGSRFILRFPYLTFDPSGLALLFSWPLVLLLAVRPPRKNPVAAFSLITAGLIAVPLVLSFNATSGEHQFGWRYAFDFLPFLLVPLVWSFQEKFGGGRLLVVGGMLLNAYLVLPVLLHLPLNLAN